MAEVQKQRAVHAALSRPFRAAEAAAAALDGPRCVAVQDRLKQK
jgi:hypothetical protein